MNNDYNISLSDKAAARIVKIADGVSNKLRISVKGGGCSGFQYQYDFVADSSSEDIILKKNGATILIDPISAEFMKNAEIDYIETLGSAEFVIKNPNSASKCGCGNSFSI